MPITAKELGEVWGNCNAWIIQLTRLRKKEETSVGQTEKWIMSMITLFLDMDTLTAKKIMNE